MNITKKAKLAYIRSKLSTDSRWQLRALELIYARQTSDEQTSNTTNQDNDIGFSGAHAEICSSLAKQYQMKKYLSPKQMSILARIMPRYAKQVFSETKPDKLVACMYKDKAINEVQAFEALT